MPGIIARDSSIASHSSQGTRRRLFLEQLDRRDMFAGVTGFVYWNTLYLDGTAGDDVIEVRFQGDQVEIPGAAIIDEFGDYTTSLSRQSIFYIVVSAYGGNDQLLITDDGSGYAPTFYAYGGAGNDVLSGGSAFDYLLGEEGDDQLYGQGGNDYLDGGAGLDSLMGGTGDDRLTGGYDYDYMSGGEGYDTLVESGFSNVALTDYMLRGLRPAQNLYIYDTLYSMEAAELTAAVAGLQFAYFDARAFSGNTVLRGSSGADTLLGGKGADVIYGGAGADTIDGGAGSDTLYGEAGNDTLTGGLDFDNIYGGGDIDTLVESSLRFASLTNSSLTTSRPTQSWNVVDNLQDVEAADLAGVSEGYSGVTLHARRFSGKVTLRGTNMADYLYGGAGNDTIYAQGGNDWLFGDAGSDYLFGDGGNDQINGEAGYDYLFGGSENDFLDAGAAGEYVDGGAGVDFNAWLTAVNGASITDIRQGGDVTCWVLAGLGSAVNSGARLQDRITYFGNNYYRVNWLRPDGQGKWFQDVFFNGNTSSTDPQTFETDGATTADFWQVIYQRAVLQQAGRSITNSGSGGAYGEPPLYLGRNYVATNASDFTKIQDALNAKKAVMANIPSGNATAAANSLPDWHWYSVVGLSSTHVTLYNPHGSYVTVTRDVFKAAFDSVSIV